MVNDVLYFLGLFYIVLFCISTFSTEIFKKKIKFIDFLVRLKYDRNSVLELSICLLVCMPMYFNISDHNFIGSVLGILGWVTLFAMKMAELTGKRNET